MKATRSSTTAEQMAVSRAIETRKPESERICSDPLAERFLGARYRLPLLLGRPLRDAVERAIERRFAGHHYYVIARTRYFDDFLRQRLAQGLEQLVILGAGYDSRAQRFAKDLRGAAVFEVDHPATSAMKQAKLQRLAGLPSVEVRYVPVDFNTEKLADRLRQSGYQDRRRTVFLWEGVTPYLGVDAVDEVLRFVTGSAAPGSAILFDYILRELVEGRCTLRGAQNEFDRMSRTSEPLTFGIAEGEAPAFLAARGFRQVVDVGAAELKSRYFAGHEERYVKPWWRMVYGETA